MANAAFKPKLPNAAALLLLLPFLQSLLLRFLLSCLVAAVAYATGSDAEHQPNDAAGDDHGDLRHRRRPVDNAGSASGQWRRTTWRTVNAGGRRIWRRSADENNTVGNGEAERLRTEIAHAIDRTEHRAGARTVGNVDDHLSRVCGVLRQEARVVVSRWRGEGEDGDTLTRAAHLDAEFFDGLSRPRSRGVLG